MQDLGIQHHLFAAQGYIELEMFEEAVTEMERIPAYFQHERDVLIGWVALYQHWGKWKECREVAERLCQLDPNNLDWTISLAYATRRSHGLEHARVILQSVAIRFPENAVVQFNLACYAAQLGHLNEARERLEQAVRLDERFAVLAQTDPDLEPIRKG
jgi:tetratricopeptide (TPR) repeat protein